MADFLATNEFAGTGAVMQVEVNFAGVRVDLPNQPAPYLEADDVKAAIVIPATNTTVEVVTPITLTQINALTFRTDVLVPVGQTLRVYRSTDIEFPIVDFVSLQVVTESDLDSQARQTLYAVMESSDNAAIAVRNSQTASETATQAFVLAEQAVDTADAATVTADSAQAAAAAAVGTANAANSKADTALANAAAAEAHAESVEVLAQQAGDDADAAAQSAADANTAANTAITTANGIDAKAQSALDASAAATTTANQAAATANGIAATANQANATANSANATAGQALTAANNAQAAVDGALTGKQDHAARLDQLVQLPATSGMYSVVTLNGGGVLAKLTTSPFVGDTLMPSADANTFRVGLGLGAAQNVNFASVTTTGNVTANGYVAANTMGTVSGTQIAFTGGINAAGDVYGSTLRAKAGTVQIWSSTASANAHCWFYDNVGNSRAVIYADSAGNVHIQSGGTENTVFSPNGLASMAFMSTQRSSGQSVMYSPYAQLDGNMYGQSCLQLQGTGGGVANLGFHNAGRVAGALWLNADGQLWWMANSSVNSLMLTNGNLMGQIAGNMVADAIGSICMLRQQSAGNVAVNGLVAGASCYFSDIDKNNGGTPSGTWRCLGNGIRTGVTNWVRVS
ncbi:tail fiber protein [Pseudomonas phage Eisa9]|uniref:Tail fiber protein n=1 Tax=Pseudomonas phage Eisa9 TaxID=2900148 RepID=A0AAE9C8Z6_9CAUD|nr:tail fiber protein [Pseudomonas phage Eisa9]